MKKILSGIWALFKNSLQSWREDQASLHAAALAYYMIFSLAPILLVLIGVLSIWLSQESAQTLVVNRLYTLVGVSEGFSLLDRINNLTRPASSPLVAGVEIGIVIFGASNLFAHLRRSLNLIWHITPDPDNRLLLILRKRLAGISILAGMGIIVLVSVALSTFLSAFQDSAAINIPYWLSIVETTNKILGFLGVWTLFAVIFKVLPDAKIAWKDIWIGSGVTTILFYFGQTVVGMYIRLVDLGSGYGAASSLIILLVWVYYIAQAFYFGAEFVEAYANTHGSKVAPAAHAEWIN